MVIEPHMKQGRQHKLISTIFLATSVTKKLDHNNLKALSRQCKRETLFCDMDDYTVNLFSSEDTYPSHFHTFEMDGFTVRIENSLLAEALENLDGKKRDVILRYYFLGFDDTEISKILEVNRSTIQRRRHAGLEFIKKFMEEEA